MVCWSNEGTHHFGTSSNIVQVIIFVLKYVDLEDVLIVYTSIW